MLYAQELAKYISMPVVPQAWINVWEECLSRYQRDWLDRYDFKEIADFYNLEAEWRIRIDRTLMQLKQSDSLDFLCYLLYYILFEDQKGSRGDIWTWEVNAEVYSGHGSWMINTIALLCGYPLHRENMKRRNFDDFQIEWQKKNIRNVCNFDPFYYGLNGIRFSQMGWGSVFIRGEIIQVGRLQYEIGINRQETLESRFPDNTQFISIHIPRGKTLDRSEVEASLSEAESHIRRYCPQWQDREIVFYTSTWLLSPELADILPENSNIICFQRRFETVKIEECRSDFLQFAFDLPFPTGDNNDLPEKTMLQRELKKRLLDHKPLHIGLGYLKTTSCKA